MRSILVSVNIRALAVPQIFGTRSVPRSLPKNGTHPDLWEVTGVQAGPDGQQKHFNGTRSFFQDWN